MIWHVNLNPNPNQKANASNYTENTSKTQLVFFIL